MRYATNEVLPLSVRNRLPPHALDIYRQALDHAYRHGHADEATAHRIAWAAVKRCEKLDGAGVRRLDR